MKRKKWPWWLAGGGLALAAGLVFAWWYMIGCVGNWQGAPLEHGQEARIVALEEELRADVAHLSVEIGERNLVDEERYRALTRAGLWIRDRWAAQGYEVAEQPFTVAGRTVANYEIELPGRRAPAEIVLVSAQYDTLPGSPGANNNAGGEAVLLALSAMLCGTSPGRTVRLVSFTTEEDPWFGTADMGSVHYAARCRQRGEDIRAMLSLDAIGYYRHEPGSQRLPFPFSALYPDRGEYLAFIGNLTSRRAVVAATRGFRRGSAFPIAAGLAPEWVPGVTWSDHASFWQAGYPAVQVTDTGAYRSPFHTSPGDTLEKLDFHALARITFGIYGALLELATPGS